ncbi:MAG: hypothetical protein CMF52_04430 [Legionellales bacterium]|nr:hypothetical protein [Legionellales bacterium]HAV94135.1 hypothetical protein [Pseudomonadota bacterium]
MMPVTQDHAEATHREKQMQKPRQLILASALLSACKKGHIDGMNQLIEQGADINAAGDRGITPLMIACLNEHDNVVENLLSMGASVNAVDQNGLSALWFACLTNRETTIIDRLINADANVNVADQEGNTSLMVATVKINMEKFKKLVEAGADRNGCIDVLMRKTIMPHEMIRACKNGQIDYLNRMIQDGNDLNSTEYGEHTPLTAACAAGQEQIVSRLIEAGADVNMFNARGRQPIVEACLNGHGGVIKILASAGVDLNQRAVVRYNTVIVQYLVKAGVDARAVINSSDPVIGATVSKMEVEQVREREISGEEVEMELSHITSSAESEEAPVVALEQPSEEALLGEASFQQTIQEDTDETSVTMTAKEELRELHEDDNSLRCNETVAVENDGDQVDASLISTSIFSEKLPVGSLYEEIDGAKHTSRP